jgi:hypothetical protein
MAELVDEVIQMSLAAPPQPVSMTAELRSPAQIFDDMTDYVRTTARRLEDAQRELAVATLNRQMLYHGIYSNEAYDAALSTENYQIERCRQLKRELATAITERQKFCDEKLPITDTDIAPIFSD